jgi:hypothetical protein
MGRLFDGVHRTDLRPKTGSALVADLLIYGTLQFFEMDGIDRAIGLTPPAAHTEIFSDQHVYYSSCPLIKIGSLLGDSGRGCRT